MILFLGHSGEIGGAELCQLDIARHFRNESRVLLFSDGPFRELLESENIDVTLIRGGNALHRVRRESRLPGAGALASVLSLARRVAAEARAHDLLYAYTQKAFVIGCAAVPLCRRPLLWHLHDILSPEHFSAANIKLDVALGNRLARRVVAVSHAVKDAFVQNGGKPRHVRVVHNGIDPTPFTRVTSADTQRAREELGLQHAQVAGCFSRLSPWKGQHQLIEAASALPGLHLLLVGGTLFGSTEYEQTLRNLVKDYGMEGRVHFLGNRNDVPVLMRACDLIVHCSTAPEPFARVVIEAMLAGRPLVAARAGGVVEIVEDGWSGMLFEPGNVPQLRRAIAEILAEPARAASIAANAQSHATRNFGLAAMLNGVEQQVRELVAA